MQAKKILAGAIGLLFVGSTLAFAQTLEKYPSPFVTSEGPQSLIVVGANAAASDVVGAVDIAARLGGATTKDVTVSGTTSASTVSGEGKEVATTNTKLYLTDNLRKTGVRYTMTSSDLPVVLKSGIVTDTEASATYTYDQYIDLSNDYTIRFEREKTPPTGIAADPVVKLYDNTGGGTVTSPPSISDYLYRARAVFNKEVNLSTSITSGATIELFGNEYTFSSGSALTAAAVASTDKIVLFGSSNTKVMTGGESTTVTIGGTSYEVKLVGASGDTTAVVNVNGAQDSIIQGSSKDIGGLTVFANKVWRFSTTDQTQNQAKLGLGAETITFQHGQRVYKGTGTPVYIDGTFVQLGGSNGKLTTLDVYVSGPKATYDALKVGNKLTDPVFKTFDVNFPSLTPDLKSSTRDMISVTPSGDNRMTVTFTDYSGKSATINYAYNATSSGTVMLADASGYVIHVKEGDPVKLNEYFVADAGDYPHVFQLTNLNNDGTSTGSIELTDKFSGSAYTITMGTGLSATKIFDGQSYYVNGSGSTQNTSISFYWGDGASVIGQGTERTIYPKIRGKSNEYLVFVNQTTLSVARSTSYNITLPNGVVNITVLGAADGDGLANFTATAQSSSYIVTGMTTAGNYSSAGNAATGNHGNLYVGGTATGGVYYKVTQVSNNTIAFNVEGSVPGTNLTAPALMLIEEQEKDSAGTFSVIVPTIATTISSISKLMAGTPDFTYTSKDSADFVSDSYKTGYLDKYGVYAELYNKNTQYTLNIYYPDDQMTANFFVLGKDGTVSTTAGTSSKTVKESVPITTSLGRLDSDVKDSTTIKSTKHLILVGGPCANDLVKEIATKLTYKGKELTCANWDSYTQQGEKFGMIQLVSDAFATGKYALVVAGSTGDETLAATKILLKYGDYETKLTGKTAVLVTGTGDSVDVTDVPAV